jgi:phosphate transport system permease protein
LATRADSLTLAPPRKRWGEVVIQGILALCAIVSVATTVGIVFALFLPAFEFFQEVSFVDYITGTEWAPLFLDAAFGVIPLIAGTLSVTFWACLVAVPCGLGAAIFLSEYASPRMRKTLKPALETLAGIPTVVFGYFALTFATPLLRDIGLDVEIFNALSAGLVMGVMIIPTVASLSEDAMSAVPSDLRQGAYALGSTKLQVSTRIVVPAAVSGIVAAFVLGSCRDDGRVHRSDRCRRRADRLARIQDDLCCRGDALRHDLGRERHFHPPRAEVPGGIRMTTSAASVELREDKPRGVWRGRIFVAFLLLSLAIGFVTLGTLIIQVLLRGIAYVDPVLLTNPPSSNPEIAGARPAILATLYLGIMLIAFTVPIGVGTAVYLEEYANRERWYNRLLELNIQNLAAVPSIVYGILGLAFLVRGIGLGRVLLAGALILTLLVLPTVIIAAREAVRAVPPSIREGAYALGATKWQVTWRQVLPAAIPGIATGSILAVARAIGETAPLLLIGALTYISFNPTVMGPFTALPVQIYNWTKLPNAEFKNLAAAAIILLLVLILLLNAGAIYLRNRYQKKW